MMATLRGGDGPPCRGLRRAHPGGARHRHQRRRSPTRPSPSSSAHGTLELRDVGFDYPGAEAPVLEDISFTSLPGQTTAIIGSTGSGKTTLVNLVPRLFDVTAGAVLVDGVDVRELDPEVLWSRIGLVPQKPYLFSGTVASNLRYGKPDATDEEMWEALEVAQAADFVRAMPAGSTPASPRAAPTCRAASASGSPSPGRSCAGPRSTCSTTRSRPSTSPPTPACGPPSCPGPATPRSWSSPSGCPPSSTPTRSSCSRTARSSASAPTTSCSSSCPTYAEIVASQTKQQEAAA